jgi:hypothetical protein
MARLTQRQRIFVDSLFCVSSSTGRSPSTTGASSRPPTTACWWFLTDRGLDFLVVGEPMPDNGVSVPAIAVAGSTLDAMNAHLPPNLISDFSSMLGDSRHPG